jgi:hypothetical protein
VIYERMLCCLLQGGVEREAELSATGTTRIELLFAARGTIGEPSPFDNSEQVEEK